MAWRAQGGKRTLLSPLLLLLCCPLCMVIPAQQAGAAAAALSYGYYNATCPNVESIVSATIKSAFHNSTGPVGPNQLLRLVFHDCFVRGCDASILLDGNTTEKTADPNLSVGGYDTIDLVKAALEASCPGIVSCADIIVLAARESVLKVGGPYIPFMLGRKDGTVSLASEALQLLPSPTSNLTTLLSQFSSQGFSAQDLVALSGAHSIGHAHCQQIANRLPPNVDPTLDPAYESSLNYTCVSTNKQAILFNDPVTNNTLDNQYYKNVVANRGLFSSDAALKGASTFPLVQQFANNQTAFFNQFIASMQKLSQVGVLLGSNGQVRKSCQKVN